MRVNFIPPKNGFNEVGGFRFWCQKVLPMVYDDSLSYYEVLGKVVNYLNQVIENLNNVGEDTSKLYEAVQQLQEYVNHYFDNLDVQAEINNKLDGMVKDGSLSEIFAKLFVGYVTPEMFGAKGDGINDDTNAIQEAINTNFPVLFMDKTYAIFNTVMLQPNSNLIGNKSIIKLMVKKPEVLHMFHLYNRYDSNIKFNVTLRGITFDGGDNAPTLVRIENYTASESCVTIEKCCFYNAYWSNTFATTSDRNAFIAIVGNYNSAVINDSIFDRCGRDAEVGRPSIYGTHSVDITNSVIDGNNYNCKNIIFERNSVSNVYTDDDPDSDYYVDCDGLRFFTGVGDCHLTITNNKFVDCVGRAIKIHTYGNVVVCNNNFYQENRTALEHGIFVDSQFVCNNIIKNNYFYRKTVEIDGVAKLNKARGGTDFGVVRVEASANNHFEICDNKLCTDKETDCYICGIVVGNIAQGIYGVISNNIVENITSRKLVSLQGVLGVRCELTLENQVNPNVDTGLYFDNMGEVSKDISYWDVTKYRITLRKCEFGIQYVGNLFYIIVDGDYEDMYTDGGSFIRHRIYTTQNYKVQYCVAKFVCGSVSEGENVTHLVEWLWEKQKEGFCIIRDLETNKALSFALSTPTTTWISIDGEPGVLKFNTGTEYVSFTNTSTTKSYEIEVYAKMV